MRTEGNHQGIKNMSLIRLNVYPREKQKKKEENYRQLTGKYQNIGIWKQLFIFKLKSE